MPNAQDDKRALDIIIKDPNTETARSLSKSLGIGADDVRAWSVAAQNEGTDIATKLRNKVFDRVANNRPADRTRSGVSMGSRIILKNLIQDNLDLQQRHLTRKGFQTQIVAPNGVPIRQTLDARDEATLADIPTEDASRSTSDLELQFKRPNETQWQIVDPDKLEFFDVVDVTGDVLEALAVGFSAAAGGIFAPLTAAGGQAAFETGRQAAGIALGEREEFDPSILGVKTLFGFATPPVLRTTGAGAQTVAGGLRQTLGRLAPVKKSAPKVFAAARELGIEEKFVTPAQVLDSEFAKSFEDVMRKEVGFLAGSGVRKAREIAFKKTSEFVDTVLSARGGADFADAGLKASNLIKEEVDRRLKPAVKIYKKLEKRFKRTAFKPDTTNIQNATDAIKKEFFASDSALSALNSFEKKIPEITNLTNLKRFRTNINGEITTAMNAGDHNKAQALGALYQAVTKARNDTLNDLITTAKVADAAQLKKELAQADKIFSEVMKDVEFAVAPPGARVKGRPKEFLKKFFAKNQDVKAFNKLFPTLEPSKVGELKKRFPKAFEVVRAARLESIYKNSFVKEFLSPDRFMSRIRNLPDRTKVLLFGEESIDKIRALQTVLDSIPGPINPPNTAPTLRLYQVARVMEQLGALKRQIWVDIRTKPQLERDIFSRWANYLKTGRGIGRTTGLTTFGTQQFLPPKTPEGLGVPPQEQRGFQPPQGRR